MKVWIVTQEIGVYETYIKIVKVFDSEQKAFDYIEKQDDWRMDVADWEVE